MRPRVVCCGRLHPLTAYRSCLPGEEFNRALLRIWLGEHPADAALKKAMLGSQ